MIFSESFVGGFIGFRRTYGALVRFESNSIEDLQADWASALLETSQWRIKRGSRAVSLTFYVVVEPLLVWPCAAFIGSNVLVTEDSRPPELRGLKLELAVWDSRELGQFLDLVVYNG